MNDTLLIRDIHLPDSVAWWPIAPGCWLLLLLSLFFVLLAYQAYQKHRRLNLLQHHKPNQKRLLYQAQQLLKTINSNANNKQFIEELSVLLRRTAISLYGREKTAGLTGKGWLQFLDDKGKTDDFAKGKGQALIVQPYKKLTHYERSELVAITQKWLDAQSAAESAAESGAEEESSRGSQHV